MSIVTDQMGRRVNPGPSPLRIISLVPSQTELLFDLGLNEEVVGITKFCIHPNEMFQKKPRIGGTKQFDFEKIKSLQPTLIIGNKEENDQSQVEVLMSEYPVWMSDIKTLDDALDMILGIGRITNKEKAAVSFTKSISENFQKLKPQSEKNGVVKSVAYLIWKDPLMTINRDTFINEMLERCGFTNIFSERNDSRYPKVADVDLTECKPDYIFLSSEPYPFKEKHLQEFQSMCPGTRICLVDGEMFSWYGSRLLQAPAYFKNLLSQLT